jgi:hypothetical protein
MALMIVIVTGTFIASSQLGYVYKGVRYKSLPAFTTSCTFGPFLVLQRQVLDGERHDELQL